MEHRSLPAADSAGSQLVIHHPDNETFTLINNMEFLNDRYASMSTYPTT